MFLYVFMYIVYTLAIGGQNGWTKLADFFRKLMGTLDPVDHRVKIIRIIFFNHFFSKFYFFKFHVQRRALQLLCKNNIHITFKAFSNLPKMSSC